eukprot:TRINITY_DN55463_c0_g1_i1.p1 TRINITY_DN55463_c0_g1~~TRINITY_DN55463_c0_g1_i1.p1  ORF type:complete len:372 (+),score=20.53 TRINITY_DN55463_c0_g1_i1:83-1198(+)
MSSSAHWTVHWFAIAIFAILGTLLRLLLVQLADVDDHQMSSTLYSNFVGCFVIAIVNSAKPQLDQLGLTPVFNGISAGFCGALTTFSTWNLEIVRWVVAWPSPVLRAASTDIHAFSAVSAILTELGVSAMGFQIGHVCAESLREPTESQLKRELTVSSDYGSHLPIRSSESERSRERRLALYHTTTCPYLHGDGTKGEDSGEPYGRKQLLVYALCFASVMGMVSLYAALSTVARRFSMVFILSFAPVGALLRYYLGLWCNSWRKHVKVGTLFANAGACLVVAACTVFEAKEHCFEKGATDYPVWWADLLLGITFGFCGALSTMSTLVAQLFEMDIYHSMVYFSLSLLVSQVLMVACLGIFLRISGLAVVCA